MSLKLNERYPARFNNPTAGYPQGSFKNRTTPTAKDGSYLEKDWANDKEGFFQSLLSAAGITANGAVDAVGASQFFDALQALKQIQAGTAFTTAGSAGALTLTPVPAIQAYASPLRFRVKFSQNSTGADTINVSGQGAKSLKQYDSTGAKVAAVFAANQLADIEYDGTDFVLLDALPPASSVPIGSSIGFYLNSAPTGFLKENGAAVSRATYAALFAVIGTTFGAGDGSTTFNLPDSRSLFGRAADDGKGIDTGRVVGSSQAQSIQSHTHAILQKAINFTYSASPGGGAPGSSTAGSTEATGGAETRPANIAKLYCIKY
jgi:microcystin-dependent protein